MDFFIARLVPDGALVVEGYSRKSRKMGLYRAGSDGGAPQLLFETEGWGNYQCTDQRANFCVYGQLYPDQKDLAITSFDPVGSQGKELLRIPDEPGVEYHWALSPDGDQVGFLKSEWTTGQIRFFQVHGAGNRTITVKGYANLRSLDWAADSKSMFVGTSGPSGATLLRIDLDGNAEPLWQQPQSERTWGIPSPDGRHLAMYGWSSEANVWMIDNF
jgi:hypothetical protein